MSTQQFITVSPNAAAAALEQRAKASGRTLADQAAFEQAQKVLPSDVSNLEAMRRKAAEQQSKVSAAEQAILEKARQRTRLVEHRDNLKARIDFARNQRENFESMLTEQREVIFHRVIGSSPYEALTHHAAAVGVFSQLLSLERAVSECDSWIAKHEAILAEASQAVVDFDSANGK